MPFGRRRTEKPQFLETQVYPLFFSLRSGKAAMRGYLLFMIEFRIIRPSGVASQRCCPQRERFLPCVYESSCNSEGIKLVHAGDVSFQRLSMAVAFIVNRMYRCTSLGLLRCYRCRRGSRRLRFSGASRQRTSREHIFQWCFYYACLCVSVKSQ